jgi:hypothetical protein
MEKQQRKINDVKIYFFRHINIDKFSSELMREKETEKGLKFLKLRMRESMPYRNKRHDTMNNYMPTN